MKQIDKIKQMNAKYAFTECRLKLWELLDKVDMSYGCKSYEGEIMFTVRYPNYFEAKEFPQLPVEYIITLNCYVLGDTRHYTFKGKTSKQAVIEFAKWLDKVKSEVEDNG